MDSIQYVWGLENTGLNALQVCVRAFVTFIVAIALLRIAGRRTFGLRSPFDNTIVILIGAILAKGVVGSIPYFSTIMACLVLAVTHRLFGYFSIGSGRFGALVKGEKILLYCDGKMNESNMRRSLVTENDLMESVRINGYDSLEDIKAAYMERNGMISIIRK